MAKYLQPCFVVIFIRSIMKTRRLNSQKQFVFIVSVYFCWAINQNQMCVPAIESACDWAFMPGCMSWHRMLNVPAATQHPSWQTRCCWLCMLPATHQTGTKHCYSSTGECWPVSTVSPAFKKMALWHQNKKVQLRFTGQPLPSILHDTTSLMTTDADKLRLRFLIHHVH